jgi:type VI secretion system protein ImpH
MARTARQSTDPLTVIRQIQDAPEAYELFGAIRDLECAFAAKPRFGRAARPADEGVRLGQRAYLSFAPRSIESVEMPGDGRPPRVRTYPLGLFGPQGPLPLHLTEHAHMRETMDDDPTFGAFADVFHHRMISLWYRAWADAQPVVGMDRPQEDGFAGHLDALAGVGLPGLKGRDAFPANARRFFAGRMVNQSRNAEGLEHLIAGLFDVPLQILAFHVDWLPLPQDGTLRMGCQAARMGHDATVGAQVRNAQHRFRLRVGPLDAARYREFLPGGHALDTLTATVREYLGDEFGWDLQLVLAREDVPAPLLGKAQRMGMSMWLGRYPRPDDADDLVLNAPAKAGATPLKEWT